jgi:hypothetical protein
VEVGETNANEAVILAGLSSGDKVFVSTPLGLENDPVNLIPEMDGKRLKKEPETEPIELEPMITLPNGQVVPASRFRRPAGATGNPSGSRPQGDR